VPIVLALVPVGPVLTFMRQPAEVVPVAVAYVHASIAGIFPILAFTVLRQTLQAMHRTTPIVGAILVANVVNVALNWILIFGHLGAPAMGAAGSGWSTSAARWMMAISVYVFGRRHLAPHVSPLRSDARAPAPLLRMLLLGAPIGVQYVLELGAFGAIALLMGFIGTAEVAAHQIALNLASLTFMAPLGISAAAAVRVGNAIGRADLEGAKHSARAALSLGIAVMAGMAVLLIAVPDLLARAYTSEASVVLVAVALIPIAGFFQVFDGIQVVAVGVLRGLGDTTAPMLINILGFWLIGLPVSLWLAFRVDAGPEGLWWGLVAGLVAVALLLLGRMLLQLRRPIERVEG
jgi:MATE family multidrug resistance protein